MEPIYSRLRKDFGLKDKHIAIIKELENKQLAAEDICKKTAIPHGRIYEYLNTLVNAGIVEKSATRPFRYSIKSLERNIVGFTKHKIDTLIRSQSEIMYALRQDSSQYVELIRNAAMFTQNHINMISEVRAFHVLCIHQSFPYILYPESFDDFVSVRQIISSARPTITHTSPEMALLIYRSYMDALKEGKRITVLFEKETFDFHMALLRKKLGADGFRRMLKDVIAKLEKYDARVYVIEEYSPMQVDVNEHRVCLSLRYGGVTSGIAITNKEVVKFYDRVFHEKIGRSQTVVPLLGDVLKGI